MYVLQEYVPLQAASSEHVENLWMKREFPVERLSGEIYFRRPVSEIFLRSRPGDPFVDSFA